MIKYFIIGSRCQIGAAYGIEKVAFEFHEIFSVIYYVNSLEQIPTS